MSARVLISTGEPAGIGPDIALQYLAERPADGTALVVIADPLVLEQRASQLGLPLQINSISEADQAPEHLPGQLSCLARSMEFPVVAGKLNAANSECVLDTLSRACDLCLDGRFDALVTGPVNKAVINDAGFTFSGHTEFLAQRCGRDLPVMLLVARSLRVALVTTHLPISKVAVAITTERVLRTCEILSHDLKQLFGISEPKIAVCGLNPHAGDGGHLGTEDEAVIAPALESARAQGIHVLGPLPADTAFTPPVLANCDAVLAMYHDQGLPVLKHVGFGHAVNVTLGLPICRTSVDHGTALDLAGSGRSEYSSMAAATELAITLAKQRNRAI